MSRIDFTYQPDIHINDILLDHENARIRAGSDQNDCIGRILRKESQLIVLMEDIAKNGLSTMPILVSLDENGKWVVKDGNRRITALKLLNDPERCPEDHLKGRIRSIRNKYLANIPESVDCLAGSSDEAIIKEVIARHSGALDGAGQLDWSAYLRTVYLLNHGHSTDYKRVGQYLFWAEKQGLTVEDDFPITNVQRFFNADNLVLLGFKIENDELTPALSINKIKQMAARIILDFGSRQKTVSDVFKPETAKKYLEEVRAEAGIISADEDTTNQSSAGTNKGTEETGKEQAGSEFNTDSGDQSGNKESTSSSRDNSRPPSPRNHPSNRNKIFGRSSPGISVPENEVKVRTIIAELRMLDVKKTPFACTMLFRALLELSDGHYRKAKNIQDKNSLAKNVSASADSMLNQQLLSKSEHEVVMSYSQTTTSMLHVNSLQKMLHRDTHHSDYQVINTFWDGIGCFVRACWTV